MRRRFIVICPIILCFLLAHSAYAQFGVSVKVGTPGIGVDLTGHLTDTLNARLGLNMFNFSYDDNGDDSENGGKADEISAELKLLTVPALLDWHPWKNRFRLSAGLVLNNNKINLSAVPGDTVDINDNEYAVSSLSGEASFNSIAPYIGIGCGNAAEKANGHWHFAFDLGVMFQGAPEIDLAAVAANASQQASLDIDLEAEKKDLEDDAKVFNVYPVLTFGVSYTF